MHILGLQGMIRREYTYPESLGLTFWNQISTLGAFLIAVSILVFIVNVIKTQVQHRPLETNDPWDARTLEWTTASPPPVYNFDEIPTVHSLDEFWHRKYAEDKSGQLVPVQAGAADDATTHGAGARDPPAEPVVLAVRRVARAADHGVRRHLLVVVGRRWRSR